MNWLSRLLALDCCKDCSSPDQSGDSRRSPEPIWKSALPARLAFALCLLGFPAALFAQPLALPLEIHQPDTLWNLQSVRGVPITTNVNPAIGSDGRGTNYNESTGFNNAQPTTNQFASLVAFGATPGLVFNNWIAVSNSTILKNGTNAFSGTVAQQMKLPRAETNNVVILALRRVQVGVPFLTRQISFPFGSVIDVPFTDEGGLTLTNVAPQAYWLPEPFTTTSHTNSGYYWSPNARKVYAIQPGPITIRWMKATYSTSPPADYSTNYTLYYTNAGRFYRLYNVNYIVSGSPIKTPRRMYWTERGFRQLGKPILVPSARVRGVAIAYNNNFPQTVAEQYVGPGDTDPTQGTTNQTLVELRTLWYDQTQGSILAYNQEGRAFLELLGDPHGDTTREQLATEIVDVFKQPTPEDILIELGDRVTPPPPGTVDDLTPEPVLQAGTPTFAYNHNVNGSDQLEIFAVRETSNENDYLIHWMETGEVGLKWPFVLGRYQFTWPTDAARYSHYVRPLVATEDEAKLTAVPLSTLNVPTIAYQDPLDQPRAKLTDNYGFYTFLDVAHPAHRTLLRYNSGEHVAFERVFSWLDQALVALPSFTSQFDADDPAANTFGNAYVTNGVLHLTDAVNVQSGFYLINDFAAGQPVQSFRATFTASLSGTADGFSFNFGTIPNTFSFAQEGIGNGLAVSFDLFDNGVNDLAPAISIKLNGVTLAAVSMAGINPNPDPSNLPVPTDPATGQPMTLSTTNGAFVPVEIVLYRSGQMDVSYKGVKVLAGIATGYTPRTGQFGLAAATGGQNSTHWFDDLAIMLNPEISTSPMAFADSVATNLVSWNTNAEAFDWRSGLSFPRVVNATVDVGQRITAPDGEIGGGQDNSYLAGYILQSQGISFNPSAYSDPFSVGFPVANSRAIIPVNAIPGTNQLEIWWFRPNRPDSAHGFATNYWPSVVGRYTIQWPANPLEIVLASKLGSAGNGPLNSFQEVGQIYTQNYPSLPGYNPNEEHAIMSGGTVFATRDDLNITNASGYSSHSFVLLQYTDADGRPAMTPFKVLREKPSVGWVFDYITEAGRLIQAPMPLPLLAKPTEGSGDSTISYNSEPTAGTDDLPIGWDANTSPTGVFGHYGQFTYSDRKQDYWVYRGLHAGLPALRVGNYNKNTRVFNNFGTATAIVGTPFSLTLHASRQSEFLAIDPGNLPAWLTASGLTISGTPATNDIDTNSLPLIVSDLYDGSRWTNTLSMRVQAAGSVVTLAPLFLTSTNNYTGSIVNFSNRPPFLGHSPVSSNSFTMRYYYKTEPGFAWPGVASPPPAGSIVPYLRLATNGVFVGDPTSKTTPALDIVYRPVWPERDPSDSTKPLPTVPYGFTLTTPASGLPGVRDWKTARLLYQQSIGANLTNARVTVVLHDPTREKSASIANFNMQQIPASVRTEVFQGKTYFPNLPPHLGKRLFFDPSRGTKGSLVLKGEFKDEIVGSDYLLLNVLRDSDLDAAKALCPASDSVNSPNWSSAIDGLATSVETFYENPGVPGTYIPDPSLTVSAGVQNLAEVPSDNTAVDSYALSATGPGSGYITLVEAGGTAFTQPGDPVALHVLKVGGSLYGGELKVLPAENPLSELVTFQHSPDLAGRFNDYEYQWKIAAPVDGLPPASDATMSAYLSLQTGTNLPRNLLGGAGIQVLGDNYVTLRYRPMNPAHPLYSSAPAATATNWSAWTTPQLAEGWIKRVLAGINPFNQRITDLFNNAVNTDASLLTQAGHRWEGDVALNLDTINNYGLIEIYETILRRGRSISIESGYNYGPANDALLLAAGYLSDLYVIVGNEAWADAANPTIGIGTANNTYADIATALFAFKGQVPSLLEEELALLRGRDDFLLPGVATSPVYNRLVWNYTRGIDAGEVVYAINYNIQENPNQTPDGIINAADAARMFPQGHGDAYGHYLTALKGYYSLLLNNYFDWVPRIEAVTVLGQPVSVDYQDERKFAAAAAAVARAGRQAFDLTWRRDYQSGHDNGWSHFSPTRSNTQRTIPTTRYWGLDHWASRVGQGGYVNWVSGNAILPAVDPNPNHEGIQKIDRTTVPELTELATMAGDLQTAMDNAEGGLTPLGLPEGSVALDINPNVVVGTDNGTHFEQIYSRAKVTLNNAVAAFDDAKDVTRLMRSEQDSLADFQAAVARQELSYNNALIELYGTPYTDDIGPGKNYRQGYTGPDLLHYLYVETPENTFSGNFDFSNQTYTVDVQQLPPAWQTNYYADFNFYHLAGSTDYKTNTIDYNIGEFGFFSKPPAWTGRRVSPGKIQQGISAYIAAQNKLRSAVEAAVGAKQDLDKAVRVFQERSAVLAQVASNNNSSAAVQQKINSLNTGLIVKGRYLEIAVAEAQGVRDVLTESVPKSFIGGVAFGGDLYFGLRATLYSIFSIAQATLLATGAVEFQKDSKAILGNQEKLRDLQIATTGLQVDLATKDAVFQLGAQLGDYQSHLAAINEQARSLDDADRAYRAQIAQGDRLQAEREVYRQRASAVVQGYRTRDAAFRNFRNEKLERYKTLFDLAARYAFLAANAYDYETGLLNTSAGRSFVNRFINARALGVVRNGEPQYAGSNTGDPGLSSALAEMKADWDVVKGRLGFNNPDAYGTTVSLRTENFRILPTTNSDTTWKDLLQQNRKRDVLADEDVRRFCMQLSRGDGLPVPGIVIEFSTTIANGYNFFGQQLAAGDHSFSPSSFATKIFGVGAALEGYRGMDQPAANGNLGGITPPDPNLTYLDPLALAATPYVYLVPAGVDSMRSPPLGDASGIRSWTVDDVAIPLPFNIGASQLANGGLYQSADSLSEPLFTIRKHQAFRPVPDTSFFSTSLYGQGGTLLRSQYTNNRLIGRSAWNSRWKLVIPGHTLLNDPDEGLERFIKTVRDIKLHFVTYSYSGN